jgi:hypothetical protein
MACENFFSLAHLLIVCFRQGPYLSKVVPVIYWTMSCCNYLTIALPWVQIIAQPLKVMSAAAVGMHILS